MVELLLVEEAAGEQRRAAGMCATGECVLVGEPLKAFNFIIYT